MVKAFDSKSNGFPRAGSNPAHSEGVLNPRPCVQLCSWSQNRENVKATSWRKSLGLIRVSLGLCLRPNPRVRANSIG